MSNLIEHGKKELELAGMFEDDSYNESIANNVINLLETVTGRGHSGNSLNMTVELFNKLVRYENLTPITDNSDEWTDVSEYMDGKPTWQSMRNFSLISYDGGKTYYDSSTSEGTNKFYESKKFDN